MSTVSSQRRAMHSDTHSASSAAGPSAKRKQGWRPFRWLVRCILLVLVVVAAAPWLIGYTPLRNILARTALDVQGDVQIGGCSLAWWSPIGLQDLEINDAAGKPFLKVPSLAGEKSLFGLATGPTAPGKFVIDGAELHLILRESSSNLEEIFANWLNKPAEPPSNSPPPTLTLELKNATVVILDETVNREWRLENLTVAVAIDPSQPQPIMVQADCSIPLEGANLRETRGQLTVQMRGGGAAGGEGSNQTDATQLSVKAASVPVSMFQALVRRFALPGAKLGGWLGAELQGEWSGSGDNLRAKLIGSAVVDQVAVAAPALGRDTFALQRVQVPCDVSISGDQAKINSLGLQCDVGDVGVQGSVKLSEELKKDLVHTLLRETLAVQGQIDIARLAKLLPETLRVRPGTEITGGKVRLALQSGAGLTSHQWQGTVETENLTAINEGKQIVWDKPISASVTAHDSKTGPAIDKLSILSSFLQADATGTPEEFTAQAEYDLARLMTELDKFVDLGEFRVAGRGNANLSFKQERQGEFAGGGTLQLQNLQFAVPGFAVDAQSATVQLTARYSAAAIECDQFAAKIQQLRTVGGVNLNEDQVQCTAAVRYEPRDSRLRLAKARLQTPTVEVDTDDLTVALATAGLPAVEGIVNLQGDLGKLQQWFRDPKQQPAYFIVGGVSGFAKLQRGPAGQTAQAQVRCDSLALWDLPGATARDPNRRKPIWQEARLDFNTTGTYDEAGDRAKVDTLDIQSQTLRMVVSGQIDRLTTKQDVDLTGRIDYDLEKITPLLWPYVGSGISLVGKDSAQFSFRGPLAALTAATPPKPAGGLRPVALGPQAAAADLTSGKPAWQLFDAQARFGWQGADLYGLRIGSGELAAAAKQGQIQIKPIDMDVAGGRLTLMPEIRQTENSSELLLPRGPILRQVQVTPEMCDNALKFVSPMLAQATRTEGTISLDTNGLRLPLGDPTAVATEGRLTIHDLEVAPGPLANLYIGLIQQVETIVTRKDPRLTKEQFTLKMHDQAVDYAVADRRVYHKNLAMAVSDFTIRTYGSVGFDETLSVMVEVVLPERFNGPIASRLPNRTISIPLEGTIAAPKADIRGAITKLGAGALLDGLLGGPANQANDAVNKGQDKANDLINQADKKVGDAINKGLDRLFNPR